jgi:predicted enzyme related to lactoylglutathione lyase
MPNAVPRHNHRIDYIELPAGDAAQLGQAKQFYRAVFGWNHQDWGNEYANTQDSRVETGSSVDALRLTKPLPVVYASDLEATLAQVKAHHGTIVRDPFAFPGGRRFHFLDPAGNEIGVWSDR